MRKEFIVRPDNKIVKCTVSDCKSITWEVFESCGQDTFDIVSRSIKVLDDVKNINSLDCFYGVSKCCEEDEFDEYIGREIADDIAVKKYHEYMSKTYNRLYCAFAKAMMDVAKLKERHDKKIENINNDIKKLGDNQ